jgi:cytochrome c-type biogenesis protein CcmH/NrfG
MIVRNEASRLAACLRSLSGVVDEVVIVDTGSTDATVSIARSFGARVHVHTWNGSFAEPRNIGLDLARGRWILYIDADERLRPVSAGHVRTMLSEATEVALRVRLRPFQGATPYWEYRLWRADPRIRFAGMIHEKMTPAIAAVAAADGLIVGESELDLEHVGYDGDQTLKHMRNLPLLRAQLAVDPNSSYNWAHLGEVLQSLGEQDQSEAAFEQAVQVARDSGQSAGALSFAELIRVRRDQGRDVTQLLDEALTCYPDSIGLAWQKAYHEMQAGRHEQALQWLERFDVDTDMPVEDTVAYPVDLFGSRAPAARGLCLFRLGRYGEATSAFRQAERFDPSELSHRLRRVLSEHRTSGRAAAAVDFDRPAPEGGVRWSARELLGGSAIDVGGVSVGLHASDAVRAAAIRTVFGRMASSDADPAVQLSFGGHGLPLPDRNPDDRHGDLRLWYDDDRLSIGYGTSVSGRVVSGRGELGGHASDLGRVFRQASGFMLASLLGRSGRFVLHGGAIQREGSAVLVLGDSGAGKSTLILGALRDGWTPLSDDLVLVRIDPSGPAVTGIPKPLTVPGDLLPGENSSVPSLRNDPRGRIQVPFEGWDRAWRSITAVIAVAHGDSEQTDTEPLERHLLLGLAVRSMLSRQPEIVRRYMPLAVALCELPAWRLRHSVRSRTRAQTAAEALRTYLAR